MPAALVRVVAAVTLPAALILTAIATPATAAEPDSTDRGGHGLVQRDPLRVATFNASLNRSAAGELVGDLSTGDDPQARAVAEIIQRTDADVMLLNEFDYADGAVDLFQIGRA